MEHREVSFIAGGMQTGTGIFGRQAGNFLGSSTVLSFNPAVTPLGIYPNKLKGSPHEMRFPGGSDG